MTYLFSCKLICAENKFNFLLRKSEQNKNYTNIIKNNIIKK